MNSENLLNEIGMIDDDIIYEAEFVNNADVIIAGKRKKWFYTIAAACLILGIILIFKQLPFMKTHEDGLKYYRIDNPEKINCTFASEGLGGGNSIGQLIVKDYSEIASSNPTRNNTEGIKELPVFKNREGLWSKTYHNINSIDQLIFFDKPAYEKTYDYSYDGTVINSLNVCYQYDSAKSVVDQLLDYSFYRIDYTINKNNNDIGWAKVLTPTLEPGLLYPIISLDEAKDKFRKGNFFCYGEERKVAQSAEIISSELIYLTDEYQTYLQPFYRFYITDTSWDVKNVMNCNNYDEFKSVSPVFIPAVEEEYLELTDPDIYFN
jgi:hypothetical protein